MREPCTHPARRLRYVGYLRGAHRVVCEVEHCGALLPLAESGQHALQDRGERFHSRLDDAADVRPLRRGA